MPSPMWANVETYVGGTLLPSDAAAFYRGEPVVMEPLTLQWGRNGAGEQPDAETASFTIRTPTPDQLFSTVHVGTEVKIWATGSVPSVANTFDDGGFDSAPDGHYSASSRIAVSGADAQMLANTAQIAPAGWPAGAWAVPRQFQPDGINPTAWDDIPTARAGDVWGVSFRVRAPSGTQLIAALRGFTGPWASAAVAVTASWNPAASFVTNGAWQTMTYTATITAPSTPVWVGAGVWWTASARWEEQTTTWQATPGTWEDRGIITVDDFKLSPPPYTDRRVLVHSGHVSELTWSAIADDELEMDVISVDPSADLGNRVIGDDPWPVQTVNTRSNRIVALAGQGNTLKIDPTLQPVQLSYRDVDAQPALDLLKDIAQSAGGVLWAATHSATGPYLWMEDPMQREALRKFTTNEEGQVIIVDASTGHLARLSACDLLREPVTWRQSVSDVTTTVSVRWLEQTIGEGGIPEPTERSVIRTDDAAMAQYGVNRESVSTELTTDVAAGTLADGILRTRHLVQWRVAGVTLDTSIDLPDTVPSIDNRTRISALMDLLDGTTRIGLPLVIVDLPPYVPAGATGGLYVEGGKYTYENDGWTLDAQLSPSPGTGESATWADAQPTGWRWNQFYLVRWEDAFGTMIVNE